MYKIGENEMVLCPYNRSHVVSKLRIQKHIIKCKNRYPEMKLITCFYNYTHRLKPEDVLKHYEICSQKMRMEEARYCESSRHNYCSSSAINKSFYDSTNSEKESLLGHHRRNSHKVSVKNNDSRFKKIGSHTNSISKNQFLSDLDKNIDDGDELTPLSLPKTVSKAFTNIKQQSEESQTRFPTSDFALPQSRGICRGKNLIAAIERQPRTNDHLLPDLSGMDYSQSEKTYKPKYFLNKKLDVGKSCNSSVIFSLFDDGKTLASDDITFDDNDEDDDGFIFKNFDKYVKI